MKSSPTASLPRELHPEQRLNYAQVETLVNRRRSWIAEKTRAGEFPRPEREGRRCTRWRAGDVLDWLQARREALQSEGEPPTAAHDRRAARLLDCTPDRDLDAAIGAERAARLRIECAGYLVRLRDARLWPNRVIRPYLNAKDGAAAHAEAA